MHHVYLAVYAREPIPDRCPRGLADSVHLAWSEDRLTFHPLNGNAGVLFAVSGVDERNVILREGVREPRLRRLPEGGFGIAAARTDRDGRPTGGMAFWTTEDFIHFVPCGGEGWPVPDGEPIVLEDGEEITAGVLEIDAGMLEKLRTHWTPVHCTGIEYPAEIDAAERTDFRVTARYSDGSVHEKRVRWDTADGEVLPGGARRLTGEILQPEYGFPLADGYADSTMFRFEGETYFLATNDNTDCVGLYLRRLTESDPDDPLAGEEALILPYCPEKGWVQTFWAPEFHVIGGRAYILFALSGETWGPQCHLMRLREGGSVMSADDWEEPVRVRREDGRFLCEDGITLDMTYLPTKNGSYAVWSQRHHIGTPLDSGSMLYIARIRDEEPWTVLGESVLLSRPLYGWENVNGTINNEGPYALFHGGRIYLTYSGGAANSYTYAVGLLTAEDGADLLCPENWQKSGVPVITYRTDEREFGPGHNSFYRDRAGNTRVLYHAETARDSTFRRTGSRRVHFGRDGRPVWDLSRDRDVPPALRRITVTVRPQR